MNRMLGLAAGALLALIALTGCYPPTAGAGPSHNMKMIVTINIDGHPGKAIVTIDKADVTVPATTHNGVDHGINRDSGKSYPSSWKGYSPQQADIDYLVIRNPTTFTMWASITAVQVRAMRGADNKILRVNQVVSVDCTFLRDGKEIRRTEISGRTSDSMRVGDAKTVDKDRKLQVTCSWVDDSRS